MRKNDLKSLHIKMPKHIAIKTDIWYNFIRNERYRFKSGERTNHNKRIDYNTGEGIAGAVVESGKTTVVKDCKSDERWAGRFDAKTGFVTRSMICVPLLNKYEVIGCIQIINKTDGSLYDDEDVKICKDLAMLTAIAVDSRGLNLGFTEEKPIIISLRDVTKTYGKGETELQVLKGVNLDIRES